MTNAELAAKVDTSDEWIVAAHRHPAALHRRRGRDDLDPRRPRRPRRRSQTAGLEPRRHRPHHRRDLDARLHLSRRRDPGPGRSRHRRGRRLRPAGGLLRLRLRRRHGRQVPALRLAQAGAGDRRRDVLAHPRLERPHDLRPVRRRRGGDRARGARERRPARLARRHRLAAALRRPPPREALCRRRPFDHPDGRPSAHGGQGSVPSRGRHGDRRHPGAASPTPA